MSENQSTLSNETEELEPSLPAEVPAEDTVLSSVPEDAEQDAPDVGDAPAQNKIFGMPRPLFHGAALGVAAGYIGNGFFGIIFGWAPKVMVPAVIGGVIGFLIGKIIYTKQQAEQSPDGKIK